MIRAFRVGRRLARPARLGTLAKEGGRRVGASARCLRRALALAHTMCRAANYNLNNQGAAPGRPRHRRLERLGGQSAVVRRAAAGAAAVWRCCRV